MLSRSCRPSGHAVSRKRSGWSLAPSSQSAQRRLIPTRRRGGAPVQSRCHRSARTLLERPGWRVTWWPRGDEVLLARVSRCCRETAIPPGTPSLGNDPGRSFAPSSKPRCDDGSTHDRSRLAPARIAIPSRRNFGRCHCRRVMAPVWRGTSRRVGRCCREGGAHPSTAASWR